MDLPTFAQALTVDEKAELLVQILGNDGKYDSPVNWFDAVFTAVTDATINDSHTAMERLIDGLVAVYIGEGFPVHVATAMIVSKLRERSAELTEGEVEVEVDSSVSPHTISHVLSGLAEAQASQGSPLTRSDIEAILLEAGYHADGEESKVNPEVMSQVWSAWIDATAGVKS